MPVMDGIQATREIRRIEKADGKPDAPSTPRPDPQHARTPSEQPAAKAPAGAPTPYNSSAIILALTASSLQSDRTAALSAGCNDFLTKPISLHWLDSKIVEWA